MFGEVISAMSLESKMYSRTMETLEAVDQLEEIHRTGDRVLELERAGKLPRAIAESLLHELLQCFHEPLKYRAELDAIKMTIRED